VIVGALWPAAQQRGSCDFGAVGDAPPNLIGYVYFIFGNLGGRGPCRIAEHTGS